MGKKMYNLVTPEYNEHKDKTYWHDVGVLFADEEATGINGATIKLNLFPGTVIKVYHRDRKQEHHRDTHESNSVPDSVPDEDVPF